MTTLALKKWLWQGTLEPDLEPLVVDTALEPRDQLQAFSDTIAGAVSDLEAQIVMLQRRRAAEQPSVPGAGSNSGDLELRNHAKALLPSLDALDRIVDYGEGYARKDEAFENWLGSVKALRTRLLRALEGIGLTAINSVGTEVDLEIHDVVAVVPAGKFPANSVVSEQQRGYYFRGKLLRDAKVIVAQ